MGLAMAAAALSLVTAVITFASTLEPPPDVEQLEATWQASVGVTGRVASMGGTQIDSGRGFSFSGLTAADFGVVSSLWPRPFIGGELSIDWQAIAASIDSSRIGTARPVR